MIARTARIAWRLKYGLAINLLIVVPVSYWLLDRTPPFERLHGSLVPNVIERGGSVRVRYVVTKRVPRDCPGTVSQEIVDGVGTTFGKRERPVGPALWEPHPTNPKWEIFTGWPVVIPRDAAPGRSTFRTVTFRYCNWLQRYLRLPIVQIGPDLEFTILCNEGFEERRDWRGLYCAALHPPAPDKPP